MTTTPVPADPAAYLTSQQSAGLLSQSSPIAPTALPLPASRDGGPAAASRVGLVLAGGGAKGAYQVGVVEYLARAGIPVHAVAGASIGALNAGIVAGAPDLRQAAQRLATIWLEVGAAYSGAESLSTRQAEPPGNGLLTAGLRAAAGAAGADAALSFGLFTQVIQLLLTSTNPVLRPEYLDGLLRRHLDPDKVRRGLPLWITVFPAARLPDGAEEYGWLVDCLRGLAGTPATWLHVNELDDRDMIQALRASAALPVLSPPQPVRGTAYRDGGLGDNTPIAPLLKHEGCDLFIVTHLNPGALWDAHEYAPGRILEIRPSSGLQDAGLLGGPRGMIDFSAERLDRLRRQGYADAERIIERAGLVFGTVRRMRASVDTMLDTVARLDEDDPLAF
jgi:NTE family protein